MDGDRLKDPRYFLGKYYFEEMLACILGIRVSERRFYRADVMIANNYLGSKEMERLNRLVSMYFGYAENQANKGISMTMAHWVKRFDVFLRFKAEELLQDLQAKVSRAMADAFAKRVSALSESFARKFRFLQISTTPTVLTGYADTSQAT